MSFGSTSRILLVDDDRRLCRFLARFLSGEGGYATTSAHDGQAMRRAFVGTSFDLVILDLGFPRGEDGVALARGLRAQSDTPLIVLSGKNTLIDKVVCLEIGADDYVTKPFEPRELLARVRTLLRRTQTATSVSPASDPAAPERTMTFRGWRLDVGRRELFSPEGHAVSLTSREFDLLAALAMRPGRVLSRDEILNLIAHRDWSPYDRSVDVLVGKLRAKLGDDSNATRLIKTVRGAGYTLSAFDD